MRKINETIQIWETLMSLLCAFLVCGCVDKLQISLLCLLQDIHDCLNHDLGGFPRYRTAEFLYSAPDSKGMLISFSARQRYSQDSDINLWYWRLYSSTTGSSQVMTAHVMTLFVRHMAVKHSFHYLSAKWLQITDQTPTFSTSS